MKSYGPASEGTLDAVPDFRALRVLSAVCKTGHLGRAAEVLHMSQPTVTRQIAALERLLGVPLLTRHARGVSPTPAGAALDHSAGEIEAELARVLDQVHASAAGRRGTVIVGAGTAALLHGLPADLQAAARHAHPEIDIRVQESDPYDIGAALRTGALDLCISSTVVTASDLLSVPLWEEVVDHAVLPSEHPLASRAQLTVDELGTLPLLLPRRVAQCIRSTDLLTRLRELGMRGTAEIVDGGVGGARLSVAAGRGWGVASRAFRDLPSLPLAIVPIRGLDMRVPVHLIGRRQEARPVVRTVAALLRRLSDPSAVGEPPAADEKESLSRAVPALIEQVHLRALLAVVSAGSIGRAARRLGITQPAVSRQVALLERAAGILLLNRSARGATLTPGGRALAEAAPHLLAMLQRAARSALRATAPRARCVIATLPGPAAAAILRPVVAAVAARHPTIDLQIVDLATPRQHGALEREEVDLAIGHAFATSESRELVERVPLVDDPVVGALLPEWHSLARRARLSAADLADIPFLFMRREFHPRAHERVMRALDDAGLRPRVDFTYDGLATVWALAAQGRGWTLGTASQRRRPPTGLTCVPVRGLQISWGLDLLARKRESSLAVRTVRDLLRGGRANEPASDSAIRGTGVRRRRAG